LPLSLAQKRKKKKPSAPPLTTDEGALREREGSIRATRKGWLENMKEYKLQDTVEALARAGTNRRKGFADSRPEARARARLSLRAFNTASHGGRREISFSPFGGRRTREALPFSVSDVLPFRPFVARRPSFFFRAFVGQASKYWTVPPARSMYYTSRCRIKAASRACEKQRSISSQLPTFELNINPKRHVRVCCFHH